MDVLQKCQQSDDFIIEVFHNCPKISKAANRTVKLGSLGKRLIIETNLIVKPILYAVKAKLEDCIRNYHKKGSKKLSLKQNNDEMVKGRKYIWVQPTIQTTQ